MAEDEMEMEMDRLSLLPDALLLSILSRLPTRLAARTSLLSRRFRHLWSLSPSLLLITRDLPPPKALNLAAMAHSALLRRPPSHPLLFLLLDLSAYSLPPSFLPSLLAKAASLALRHLAVPSCPSSDLLSALPLIFSIPTLQTLSIAPALRPPHSYVFPSALPLTRLTTLSLSLLDVDPLALATLLSQLPSLDDLHLELYTRDALTLSSRSLTKLNLLLVLASADVHTLHLSLPSLQSLSLESHASSYPLPNIQGHLPSLTTAAISLNDLRHKDVAALARLFNLLSHVQHLCLQIMESEVCVYYALLLLFISAALLCSLSLSQAFMLTKSKLDMPSKVV